MKISVIAAMGQNHVIGDDRGLPWRLPRDLMRFKGLTWGKPIIMGRKTYQLIGKPLVGRENIVLTRARGHERPWSAPGITVVNDVRSALLAATAYWQAKTGHSGEAEAMVIGGGEVYRLFLPLADRVYLTVVDGEFPGTATFPYGEMFNREWRLTRSESAPSDASNPYADRFYVLDQPGAAIAAPMAEPDQLLAG